MGALRDNLKNFSPYSGHTIEYEFMKLAKVFLYGGYISVKDHQEERYRIYLRTVEFYCHYDGKDKPWMPKDYIVYHRNGKYIKGKVPYFPLMSFHAHASGYDITFESEDLQLRYSALLRSYVVKEIKRNKYIVYNTKER